MFQKIEFDAPKDDFATPLHLDVMVICGLLGSLIDIKLLVETFYNDNIFLIPDKDATIVCEVNTITKQVDSKVILPTEKKNVTKILRKEFPLQKDVIRIRYNPYSKKTKETKKKGDNTFYNCVTLEFVKTTSNISCKIFPNGKVHIAGCRSPEVASMVVENIYMFLKTYAPNCILNKEYYELSNFRIVMLKTSFKFKAIFDLEETRNKIISKSDGNWRVAGYEPNKFSGLKIERLTQKDKVTILIFRTGSTTIAGKTVTDINEAYSAIFTLLKRHKNEISEEPEEAPIENKRDAYVSWLESMTQKLTIS